MTAASPAPDAPLDSWLNWLETLHPDPIKLGLERFDRVARALDVQLPCVKIVVGGTNGKGSTCAMLEAILRAAGYKVGLYTSPHLVRFNERIRIDGEPLLDAAIVEQFRRIDAARREIDRSAVDLSYFEFATLAALLAFGQAQVDVAILEVGLGGRLDAVNWVSADCAIVTSVDIDHVQWLGPTRETAGFEKAHIFRPGKPAVCADPMPPQSLLQYAGQIGADLWCFGRDFNYCGDRQQWAYGGRTQRRRALAYPVLRGANQLLNASAALAALEALQPLLAVPQQAVRQGLMQADLRGRFQILPGRPCVVLDVAHNPHAASVLAQNLGQMGYYPYTHAVVGMMHDKDMDASLRPLLAQVDYWYCTDLPDADARGARAAHLAGRIQALQAQAGQRDDADADDDAASLTQHADPVRAFAAAQKQAGDDDRILVFGSFCTVGAVLQNLGRT